MIDKNSNGIDSDSEAIINNALCHLEVTVRLLRDVINENNEFPEFQNRIQKIIDNFIVDECEIKAISKLFKSTNYNNTEKERK